MASQYRNTTVGTQISATGGTIDKIIVNNHTTGTIRLWDTSGDRGSLETSGGTCIGGTFTPAAGSSVHEINAVFSRGLYVDKGGTIDVSVLFNGDPNR